MVKIARLLYIAFAAVLALSTLAEWRLGTSFASRNIYSSWWLSALIALLAVSGICVAVRKLKSSNLPALMAHLALAVVALGALITHLWSVQGVLHLRQGVASDFFVSDSGLVMRLPCSLTLKSFEVINYPGTDTPMDYVSHISISGGRDADVSMNKVLSLDGHRFFQSSYDGDLRGSFFAVSFDPWGMAVSYSGYFMLFGSLIWILANPRGRFRRLLRGFSAACLAAALCGCGVRNQQAGPAPGKELAAQFDTLCCLCGGRIAPLDTYATDFCLKITGGRSFRGLSATQFLLGWILYPEQWRSVDAIKVKYDLPPGCGVRVQNGYTSVESLFLPGGECRLKIPDGARPPKYLQDLADRLQLLSSLSGGEALRIFPAADGSGTIIWLPGQGARDFQFSKEELAFISGWPAMCRLALESGDAGAWNLVARNIGIIQQRRCGGALPGPRAKSVEMALNRLAPVAWLSMIALGLGLAWLAACIACIARGQSPRSLGKWPRRALAAVAALQAASLALRGFVSGSIPVANGYETMLFLALSVAAAGIWASRLQEILGALSLTLSGFALLVAHLGISNPHITPLMPVLHSPWLSLHVMSVMISYSLLLVAAVNSAIALVLGPRAGGEARFQKVSLVLLYPAITLLCIGIFVGAIWANESWGSYWSWDPKEVWALVTLLLYAIPLHPTLFPRLQEPRRFSWYLLMAFAAVLMTYFGVNYLLGGMHSYA